MTPQFVDFNGDGHTDIITGTFDGSPHVAYGTEKGFDQPSHILDAEGNKMILEQEWDYDDKKWLNTSGEQCISAVAFDWDNDNDYDLLLGDYKKGHLYLRTNTGTNAEPKFSTKYVQIKMGEGDEPFAVIGGMTAPRLVDWNGDGLTDIVTGGMQQGGVFVYLNTGTLGAPAYSKPITLLEADSKIKSDGPKFPNSGCYVEAADYDGDGDLDLLVGGYATWDPTGRTLTEEETKNLEELDKEMSELSDKFQKVYASVEDKIAEAKTDKEKQKIYQDLYKTDEVMENSKRQRVVWEEISKLRPTKQRQAGVWLYRRK